MTSQSTPIAVGASSAIAYSGPCSWRGFTISSTAGADVVIYDGVTAAGTILAQFTLATKGMQHVDISDGTRCVTGVYVSTTAALQGHVRVG